MSNNIEAMIAKIKKQTESFDTIVLKEDEAKALIAALEQSQRAERTLESLGYTDNGGQFWKPPIGRQPNFSLMDSYRKLIAERDARLSRHPVATLYKSGDSADVIMISSDLHDGYSDVYAGASQLAVKLRKHDVGEVMHMSGFSRDYAEGWCAGNDNAIHEIRAAGGTVQGDE